MNLSSKIRSCLRLEIRSSRPGSKSLKKMQTQLKEARDREERLQEENHKQETELQGCHRGRNVQDEKIQDLRDQLNEARAREKPLKDENRRLEDEVADLKRQLDEMATKGNGPANSPGSGSTNGPGSELGNGPGSGSDNGSGSGPGSGSGNEESDGTSDGSGNGNYQFDTVKLLRELKEAKATNGELSEESEELLAHWMARVADEHNLLEFYAAVADVRRDMGKLRRRVVAFYNSLGNDDTAIRAEDALANLEKQIGDQPGEALGARLWGLKLVAEKQMLETQLMTQVVRNDTLNVKLEMAKSDEQIDMEVRKDYGIYNEAEISKRVDSETQSFRVHRRELLSRIFDCANRFDVIALQCPHQPTQEAIRAASDEYLSPLNLPRPTFQEAR
ncbi:uncharacterized protein F4812DRAFT_435040 [Daldinia caldariorum]|uniref:uncharacterized protein n=1 Tax=Daldinia caldariorum TaxID=326644 RepID=UPI00200731BC|nr:uncharacterized protein F4812DRAFT_435040 [Daldinia caldariorum]KAI1465917.1 hypothetical protein F4812DRAFT_435040 [Daldinia caldariorum]